MDVQFTAKPIHRLLLATLLALLAMTMAASLALATDARVASFTSSPPTAWAVGQTQSYAITITNAGTEAWNATGEHPVRLGVHFGQASDTPHDGWSTDQRFDLPADLAPGASVTITVAVTAPPVAGGYVLRHRMVKEGAGWFDQVQKTDVTVAAGMRAASFTSSPPTLWAGSQTQSYAITVTNSGVEAWNATGEHPVRLGVHFGQASDTPHDGWSTDQRFDLPADLAPGASVTITVAVTAPPVAGGYVLRHRMVKEGAGWFDQIQKTDVTVAAGMRAASFTSSPPTLWAGSQTQSYAITVTNSGVEAWNATGEHPVRLGVHFGQASDTPHDGWSTDQRFDLPADLAPGASVTITVAVTAPPVAGGYVLRHRMVKEGAGWFDQVQKTDVSVALGIRVAAFSSTPPTSWTPTQMQTYSITITNQGVESWNATGEHPVRLGVHFGQASDTPHDGWSTDQRFDLPADLAPGASVTITVAVTAPPVAGGYVLRHRMVKEGAGWFDQVQKTDVTVAAGMRAASFTSSPPTLWAGSQTQSYAITVTNSGVEAWNATGEHPVRLGVHFGQASDTPHDGWSTDQRFDLPADLAPGASVTITVAVTAPPVAGGYVLRHRMVKEGAGWFDQVQKTDVSVALGIRVAAFSSTPPTSWTPTQMQTYSITITNQGVESWNATGEHPVRLGVHFGQDSDTPHDGWSTDQRFDLTGDVAPGASVTINAAVTAPVVPGGYVLRHRMVKEGAQWFDQVQKTGVTVATP